jgi:hypothetical protein
VPRGFGDVFEVALGERCCTGGYLMVHGEMRWYVKGQGESVGHGGAAWMRCGNAFGRAAGARQRCEPMNLVCDPRAWHRDRPRRGGAWGASRSATVFQPDVDEQDCARSSQWGELQLWNTPNTRRTV